MSAEEARNRLSESDIRKWDEIVDEIENCPLDESSIYVSGELSAVITEKLELKNYTVSYDKYIPATRISWR